MKNKASQIVKHLLSVLLAAALLYFAFKGLDWQEFWAGLKTTRWGFVVLSLVAAYLALVFRAERWRLQLVTLDEGIGRKNIWHGSNIGNFMSLIIPGIGEFIRCAHVATKKAGYDRTLGTIIVERAWDLLAVAALLLLAVGANSGKLVPFMQTHILQPFAGRFSFSIWWLAGGAALAAVLVVLLIFAFREKSRFCVKCADAVLGIFRGVAAFGKMKGKVLFILYTAGIWTAYILMAYFTMLSVPGIDSLGFEDAIFISAVGNIASVVPTPGNLGAYHYIVGLAISSIYLGSSEILPAPLLFATLAHGSHAILLILLAIYSYILITVRKNKSSHATDSSR